MGITSQRTNVDTQIIAPSKVPCKIFSRAATIFSVGCDSTPERLPYVESQRESLMSSNVTNSKDLRKLTCMYTGKCMHLCDVDMQTEHIVVDLQCNCFISSK